MSTDDIRLNKMCILNCHSSLQRSNVYSNFALTQRQKENCSLHKAYIGKYTDNFSSFFKRKHPRQLHFVVIHKLIPHDRSTICGSHTYVRSLSIITLTTCFTEKTSFSFILKKIIRQRHYIGNRSRLNDDG